LLSLIACNSYFWRPAGKFLCVPVLNCYSCPVGTTACPIGTISAFALMRRIPFYVIGFLGLLGVAAGRALCGWACPFGFLQDLLHRIPSWKWRLPRLLNGLKYVLLAGLVVAAPLLFGSESGQGATERIVGEKAGSYDYCATICPVGTLEAGVPTLATDAKLRALVTWRTGMKIGIMVAILGLTVVSRRSFCRALCPLGALMALAHRVSLLRLRTDRVACTRCLRCVKVCPTDARRVPDEAGASEATAECVLCLDCVRNCPEKGALSACFAGRPVSVSEGTKRE
jgi:ferredoxin